MKISFFVASFLLFFSMAEARDTDANKGESEPILVVENHFFSQVTIGVYQGNQTNPTSSEPFVNKTLTLPKQTRDTLKLGEQKRGFNLWVRVTFANNSFRDVGPIRMNPKDLKKLVITNENSDPRVIVCEDRIQFIVEDGEGKVLNSESKALSDDIQKDACQFANLRGKLYNGVVVHDVNQSNKPYKVEERGRQVDRYPVEDFLGALAIVKTDKISGERNRINFITSDRIGDILGRSYSIQKSPINSAKINSVFKDTYLSDQKKGWINMIPGLDDFNPAPQGEYYKFLFKLDGLVNYTLEPTDSISFNVNWGQNTRTKALARAFLEEFIHAIRTCSRNERIEVREYNRAATYESMTVVVNEYEPSRPRDRVAFINEDGFYTIKNGGEITDILSTDNRILYLGIDEQNSRDYTKDMLKEAIDYLDYLDETADKTDEADRLQRLKNLNYPGYPWVDGYRNYRILLREVRDDLVNRLQYY